MSTAFNFPIAPTVGDTWPLPSGAVMKWNGVEWVSVGATVAITYPLTATNGTVAAPSYSFASELGMGFYRYGAGKMGFAIGGTPIETLDTPYPQYTEKTLYPKTDDISEAHYTVCSAPPGSANNVSMSLGSSRSGGTLFASGTGTSATPKIVYSADQHEFFGANGMRINSNSNQNANLTLVKQVANGFANVLAGATGIGSAIKTRWTLGLGNSEPESSGNAGSNFTLSRYGDDGVFIDTSLYISRLYGNAVFGGSAIQIPQVLCAGSSAKEMDVHPAGSTVGTGPVWPDTAGGLIAVRGATSGSYGAGAISVYSGSGGTGVAIGAGQSAWSAMSDDRLKTLDTDIVDGLTAVLAMRPIRFKYISDAEDAPMRVGLSAQSVRLHIPEAVSEVPMLEGPDKTPSAELYLSLRYTEVIPHTVAAVQALNSRLVDTEALLAVANQTIDGVHDLLDAALARITALEKKPK